jgi:protein O-mannosyl-transferase
LNSIVNILTQKKIAAYGFWLFCSLLLYGNTLNHEFALDDDLVIRQNIHVQNGIAGIPEIFSHSHTHGFSGQEDLGYRPVPLTLFAILKTVSDTPKTYHLINIVLYGLAVGLFFQLLISIDRIKPSMAMVIAALFFVHPIHTEVVANIKGLEDILQFGFLMLMLLSLYKYKGSNNLKHVILSLSAFFLALLTKEIAVTFIAIIPLFLVVSSDLKPIRILKLTGLYALMLGVYFGLRSLVLGNVESTELEALNNALVTAGSLSSQIASALWLQVIYLGKFIYPATLSFDYSFNEYPLIELFSLKGIIAVIVACLMMGLAVFGIWKKKFYGFGLAFYLITMSIVSNIFFLIGSTMADRFLFTASAGLCIAAVMLVDAYFPKKFLRWTAFALIPVILVMAGRTFDRNKDWKNNDTLYTADLENAPNSTRTHFAYGGLMLEQSGQARNQQEHVQLLNKAKKHLSKSVEILPSNFEAWYNLGVVEQRMGNENVAITCYETCLKYAPERAIAYNNLGFIYFNRKDMEKAEVNFRKAYEFNRRSPEIVSNMGLVYHSNGEYEKAIPYYEEALKIDPKHANTIQNLIRIYEAIGDDERANYYRSR